MEIENFIPKLKNLLTEKRLIHSVGVMQTMSELAEIYSLDRDKVETIGLLHDAAKDLSENQINLLVSEGHIQIQHECEADYVNYLHGPVGAYLIQKEFGITDQEIIDAIYVHTFCDCGRNFNNTLSWCMRFSDLIEPNRDWSEWDWMAEGARELRKTVFQGEYQKAALLHLDLVIKLFQVNEVPIHPNVYLAIEQFSSK